ncbi:MAG: substrate-binding domain-containing protein [Candidatus Sulfotelmatobacter sp.]|jgi:phosphate transport system substrate-binding protein
MTLRGITLGVIPVLLLTVTLSVYSDTSKHDKEVELSSIPGIRNGDSGLLWKRADNRRDQPNALVYFPTLVFGTAVIYNLPGVRGSVCLRGETLAGIFAGNITSWNDRQIVATNPGLRLPSSRIRLLDRDDESGTSSLLSLYLSHVSPSSGTLIGVSTHHSSPRAVSVHNEQQMIAKIQGMPYAIGFADFYSVRYGRVARAAVQNKAGTCELPSIKSLAAAANAATPDLQLQSELNAVDVTAPNAYPVTGFSGMIIPSFDKADHHLETTVDLLRYILTDGQKLASKSGYVALPPQLVEQELRALSVLGNH